LVALVLYTYKKPVVVVPEEDIQSRTPWLQAIGQKHGKDLSTGYIIVQPLAADCTLSFPFASHSAKHKPLSVELSIRTDHAITRSMWATLRTVCKVTRTGDRITFWREPPKKQRDKSLKHRTNPDERWRTPDGV
jgi:hypothetical protein